jgi:KaiC/GvpD/RAD55 family RecA-like ATPase
VKDRVIVKSFTQKSSWAQEFTVSKEEVERFVDPEWMYDNLIIQGHLHVIAADPGAGKTSVMTCVAGELQQKGFEVIYVLADIGQSDVRHYHEMAHEHGWTLALPDMKAGHSMMSVVNALEEMNHAGHDFSGQVLIFDTLKKMADVIDKRSIKSLMDLMRSLTAKGATIVLIAHTNKYPDTDGDPVFEGTNDIVSNCDDLIYLVRKEDQDGITTSTKPSNKVRGQFEPISFKITKERDVYQLHNFVDVSFEKKIEKEYEQDHSIIEVVTEAIRLGKHKQFQIVEHCMDHKISKRQVLPVLKRYSYQPRRLWTVEKGMQNNAYFYYLNETPPL